VPPAPFELALLLDERLHGRSVQAEVEVFNPPPLSLPILGQVGCGSFESRLEGAGIRFLRSQQATAVEAGQIAFGDTRRPFDLLGVPRHRLRAWSWNPFWRRRADGSWSIRGPSRKATPACMPSAT